MGVCNAIREKPSWAVSSILSLVYAISFYAVSNGHIPNNLLFGFCVWGSPDSPNEENGCTNSVQNSHKSAFMVDLVFTLAVGIFYFLDKSEPKKTIIYLAYAFIILMHGIMHWFIQNNTVPLETLRINCYTDIRKFVWSSNIRYILFLPCHHYSGSGFLSSNFPSHDYDHQYHICYHRCLYHRQFRY